MFEGGNNMADEKDVESVEEPPKKYRCPACGFRGNPVYLAKRDPHPNPKVSDYADVPMCPYCLNLMMWRGGNQMVED
jgi:hypothetical protein